MESPVEGRKCGHVGIRLEPRQFCPQCGCDVPAHVLARYSTRHTELREYRGGLSGSQLLRTRDFIKAHLGEDLSLAELAVNVRMSPYYFCRLFKRSTSLSPHQFVLRERVERAQELLKEHQLTLVEVASNLGFSDQSHFARVFRSVVGTTPKRYSRNH
jgi:AraC family transcriptional regulator